MSSARSESSTEMKIVYDCRSSPAVYQVCSSIRELRKVTTEVLVHTGSIRCHHERDILP